MSTSYRIICRTCKEYIYMGDVRDDCENLVSWVNRDPDEIGLIDDWDSYDRVFIRSALVFIIFQAQHNRHDVRIVTEHDAIWRTERGDGLYEYTKAFEPLLYDDTS